MGTRRAALHLGLFEQPGGNEFFSSLLEQAHRRLPFWGTKNLLDKENGHVLVKENLQNKCKN